MRNVHKTFNYCGIDFEIIYSGVYVPSIKIIAVSNQGFMNCTLETGFDSFGSAVYAFEQNKDYYIKKLKKTPGFLCTTP
jgi:E3 ubiquitin-protein ligase DOA10